MSDVVHYLKSYNEATCSGEVACGARGDRWVLPGEVEAVTCGNCKRTRAYRMWLGPLSRAFMERYAREPVTPPTFALLDGDPQ